MIIRETNIPNIDKNNIDESKIDLSNKIIKEMKPFLNKDYINKINKLKSLKELYNTKKREMVVSKRSLLELSNDYNIKKKTKKLLTKISELDSVNFGNDNLLKREITILLKVIDTLDNNKLEYHLLEITKIAKKRFFI